MKRPALPPFLPLLAGSLCLLGSLAQAAPERPRQENYPDYSKYIQALVDYQRALDAPPAEKEKPKSAVDPDKLCRDSSGGGGDGPKEKKKNNCEGKYLVVEDTIKDESEHKLKPKQAEAEPVQYESLEETISRNSSSLFPGLDNGSGGVPSTTPTHLPEQELSAADLSESGVAGLLGLFDNVRMNNLGGSASSGGLYGAGSGAGGGGNNTGLLADGTLRATLDDFLVQLSTVDFDALGNIISFGDGYSIVTATVRLNNEGNGLLVGLSSRTQTPVYIVDRDGLPNTRWDGAGAIALDRMTILVPYVEANIQAVRTTSANQSVLQVDAFSAQPIYVDFSNSTIGVAPASRDGSWIGEATPFVRFGSDSVLTIEGGTRVRAVVSKPDGMNTAFVTLNGHIGNVSIRNVQIVDAAAGGTMGFSRLGITGLEMVDTKIYVDDQRIVLDTGRGFTDMGVDIERFYLGDNDGNHIVGDFYARGARLQELRITATPH